MCSVVPFAQPRSGGHGFAGEMWSTRITVANCRAFPAQPFITGGGGEDPVRMGVPDNLQVDGGAVDTGCLHSGSVGGSRCGPSGMHTGGYKRIRQSGLIVRLTGLGPVTRASGPATNKIFNFVQGKPKRSGAP